MAILAKFYHFWLNSKKFSIWNMKACSENIAPEHDKSKKPRRIGGATCITTLAYSKYGLLWSSHT